METWFTVICIGIGMYYTFRPKRYKIPPTVAPYRRPAPPAPRRRRYARPFPVMFAELLAKTLSDAKKVIVDSWIAARIVWQQHNTMSSSPRPMLLAAEKTADLALGTGNGTPEGTERELEAGTEENAIDINKGREIAIRKWKMGIMPTKSDMAALIGGRKATTIAMIDSVSVEDQEPILVGESYGKT